MSEFVNRASLIFAWVLIVFSTQFTFADAPPAVDKAPDTTEPAELKKQKPSDAKPKPVHLIDDQAVLDNLNPIFLEIATAVIQENTEVLRNCIAKLNAHEGKSSSHKTAVGFAKLVVYLKIPDEAGFVEQVATIAGWERTDPVEAETIGRRMNSFMAMLRATPQSDCHSVALSKAVDRLWPAADSLTIDFVQMHFLNLEGYDQKASFLRNIQEQSRKLAQDSRYSDELRASWQSGRQYLARMAVELYATHFRFEEMWPELRSCLDEFGQDGKYSAELFAMAVDTLNRARKDNLDYSPELVPPADWFTEWSERLTGKGSERTRKRFANAWDAFSHWVDEPLPLGVVSFSDLGRDQKLRRKFSHSYQQPILQHVIDSIREETGIPFGVAPGTDPELIVAASMSLNGPLYRGMKIIAEAPGVVGTWERTESGYLLKSTKTRPVPTPVPSERRSLFGWLIGFHVVLAAMIAVLIWNRRRHKGLTAHK